MVDCIVGCIKDYKTGALIEPVNGYNLAPFVKIKFKNGKDEITVGNESAPSVENHAVIKSMEYGASNGYGVNVEIHDEQGSAFGIFMQKLAKCIKTVEKNYNMEVKWGWIESSCGDVSGRIISQSPSIFVMPINLEINFSQGKIKIRLQAVDLMAHIRETRINLNYGEDIVKLGLKKAIREMFKDPREPPVVNEVQFLKNTNDRSEWEFAQFPDEPKASWRGNSETKLLTALEWLKPFRTKDDKGIFHAWDSTAPVPTIIFWQDQMPAPDETVDPMSSSLGTFIVNGGSCSPVIDFSPNFQWTFGHIGIPAGNTGQGGGSEQSKGRDNAKIQEGTKAGTQRSIPNDAYAFSAYGPRESTKQANKSEVAHEYANKATGLFHPIAEADLRIQGNPDRNFCSSVLIIGKTLSIIVINPFHLVNTGDGFCPDWLAKPGCNQILSNNSWRIKGVNHTIKEGSYVTTIQVSLAAPGADVNFDAPLGSYGATGATLEGTC